MFFNKVESKVVKNTTQKKDEFVIKRFEYMPVRRVIVVYLLQMQNTFLNFYEFLNAIENFVSRIIQLLELYGQATKRIRWMPRQLEAMKDVGACDKVRGAGKHALIRTFPNGETHPV